MYNILKEEILHEVDPYPNDFDHKKWRFYKVPHSGGSLFLTDLSIPWGKIVVILGYNFFQIRFQYQQRPILYGRNALV